MIKQEDQNTLFSLPSGPVPKAWWSCSGASWYTCWGLLRAKFTSLVAFLDFSYLVAGCGIVAVFQGGGIVDREGGVVFCAQFLLLEDKLELLLMVAEFVENGWVLLELFLGVLSYFFEDGDLMQICLLIKQTVLLVMRFCVLMKFSLVKNSGIWSWKVGSLPAILNWRSWSCCFSRVSTC